MYDTRNRLYLWPRFDYYIFLSHPSNYWERISFHASRDLLKYFMACKCRLSLKLLVYLKSLLFKPFCCSSDWIEWQPDEKRRIRILDLLESVRKNTLRKSNSTASCRRDKHLRSPKTSAASLPANEETGRALRLHHSRQHSHSLRNLSSTPNHHGSHVLTHDHKAVTEQSKIHPEHHTFTR